MLARPNAQELVRWTRAGIPRVAWVEMNDKHRGLFQFFKACFKAVTSLHGLMRNSSCARHVQDFRKSLGVRCTTYMWCGIEDDGAKNLFDFPQTRRAWMFLRCPR
jgi:hypothetical protein